MVSKLFLFVFFSSPFEAPYFFNKDKSKPHSHANENSLTISNLQDDSNTQRILPMAAMLYAKLARAVWHHTHQF